MKTITIRLPDVEAAMLVELQKVNRAYRDIQGFLVSQIQQEYAKTAKGRASRVLVNIRIQGCYFSTKKVTRARVSFTPI